MRVRMGSLFRRVRTFFDRNGLDERLRDEWQLHADLMADEHVRQGLPPDEAKRQARLAIGGFDQVREASRDALGFRLLDDLVQDIRFALRQLRRSPAFTAVVVLTLALGIGSNAAMFSVANAMLLRPLPYANPASLVTVAETNLAQGPERMPVSAPNFVTWKTQSRTLDRLAAFRPWGFVLTGGGEPERVLGARASAVLFPLLGITPIVGRTFAAEEDTFGTHHVALISEGLWRRRFGADRTVVNRSLTLNGESYDIVGVLPHDSTLVDADIWAPLALEPFALQQRGTRPLTVLGRLKPGVTRAQAQADLHAVAIAIAREFPAANAGWDVAVVSLTEHLVGNARPTVLMVWSAVAIVLLIACANTANLLLARGGAHQHEVVVCLALGASRGRVLRRLLSESVLLALLGGLAGIPIAVAGLKVFETLAPAALPRLDQIRIDLVVLAFTFVVSVLTGVVFGLLPALHSLKAQVSSVLRDTSTSSLGGRTRSAFRNVALASQVALAVIVLAVAGLLVRSFSQILAVDLGFRPEHVLTMAFSLSDEKYGAAQTRSMFFDRLLERVHTIPDIVSAGLTSHLPLQGRRLSMDFAIDGRPQPSSAHTLLADSSAVSAGFFRAMDIPLRRGRAFTAQDAMGSPPVVIVNEGMAVRLWPDANPIGQRLVLGKTSGGDDRPREVVGVVADVRSASVENAPGFQIYLPVSQNPWPTMSLVARTLGDAGSFAGAIRADMLALDPNQPVYNVRSLEMVIARAVALRRFQMAVLVLFAVVGLVLATIGVYSVVAYTVRLRTREIGLRLALGAQRRDVLMLVAGSGIVWAGAGIVAGGALALAAGRVVRGMLFGIEATDPLTFVVVLSFAAAVVVLSGGIAGRRAASVDPLIALRHN